MKYYRVKVGFLPEDFIQIDETELEMCLRAHVTGKVALTKRGGSVSGNLIQRVYPDLHKILGVNPVYKLQPEDYQLLPKKIVEEHEAFQEEAQLRVGSQLGSPRIGGSQTPEIATGVKVIGDKLKIKP